MTGFLVDTNVISELTKPRPNARVVAWLEGREAIALSAITLEELTFGIERASLLAAGPRIVEVTGGVAATAGRLRAQREAAGRRVAQADMLVAACALDSGLILATRNTAEFEGCGVALFNPFD